jgi:hypothetical protein
MDQNQQTAALSLDVWLHVLSHLDVYEPRCILPLMTTCKALRSLGMPTLINSFKLGSFLQLEGFLGFLLADPAVRIPILQRLDWMCDVGRRVRAAWVEREREANLQILSALADVLEQAHNLQVLSLDVSTLDGEPRITDALVSGCSDVHTVHLLLSSAADETKHFGILARLFNQVRWPLRAVSVQAGNPDIVPLLARFAGTLEEMYITRCKKSFGWEDMPVFPRVAKLDIRYWLSYHRTPIVRAFPAVIHLQAVSSLSSAGEYKTTSLDDATESLDKANLVDAQTCEGWQHLDHVEGHVLAIHALTVPSRASVRRLCLDADLDHSESVIRLRKTLEALRPTVLELRLSCADNVDLKNLWETWTPNAMATVRCLVLTTMLSNWYEYSDGQRELYEFTVC